MRRFEARKPVCALHGSGPLLAHGLNGAAIALQQCLRMPFHATWRRRSSHSSTSTTKGRGRHKKSLSTLVRTPHAIQRLAQYFVGKSTEFGSILSRRQQACGDTRIQGRRKARHHRWETRFLTCATNDRDDLESPLSNIPENQIPKDQPRHSCTTHLPFLYSLLASPQPARRQVAGALLLPPSTRPEQAKRTRETGSAGVSRGCGSGMLLWY